MIRNTSAPDEKEEALATLFEIRSAYRAWVQGNEFTPPTSPHSIFAGIIPVAIAWLITREAVFLMAILLGLVLWGVWAYCARGCSRSRGRPETWASLIDNLLMTYQPFSPDAFRQLQETTRQQGKLTPDSLERWLIQEQEAAGMAGINLAPLTPELRFTDRSIAPDNGGAGRQEP
ncbi:hypothetical protein [Franconibacter daqui]|uniref:hypothetical protein n=1 Tax=Franconibacter daqui TaxID=2047724 RepID=UPI002DBB65C6|nr:hypothetical protein [Franconibacter daqui]MEB5924797.1 hypothetical protein [Franconibacter daqui]